jgi:hypothetical protein
VKFKNMGRDRHGEAGGWSFFLDVLTLLRPPLVRKLRALLPTLAMVTVYTIAEPVHECRPSIHG